MATELASRVVAVLTEQLPAMTRLLRELVEAESPSTDPAAQAAVFGILTRELRARGFRVRIQPGARSGGTLVASPADRRRGPYQVLLGHGDTVWPRGTLTRMPLEVDGDVARGPGVYDMKGGLVQALFALDAVRTVDSLAVTPVVCVNSDEEIGSRESTRHIRRLGRAADRVFVLEPSLGRRGDLKTARKGIGRFHVRITGKAAHAGLDPGKGASAILELSRVIQELFALNDPQRGITVNVGTIDGGLRPNVVAPEASAVVDVRVLTHDDAAAVEARILALEAHTPGTQVHVDGGIGRPPLERTPGNRRLFELARVAAGELGIPIGQATAGGGSDGNTTSLLAPTLDGLGAVGDGAHAEDEFLFVDKMAERAALLALLLRYPPLDAIRNTD